MSRPARVVATGVCATEALRLLHHAGGQEKNGRTAVMVGNVPA
ncbi:hypothetical protein [Streptomyces acidicola]